MAAAWFPEELIAFLERAQKILQKEGFLSLLRAGLRKPLRRLGVLPGDLTLDQALSGLDQKITPACAGQAVFVCTAARRQHFLASEEQLERNGWTVQELTPELATQAALEPGAVVWWLDEASWRAGLPAIGKRPGWQRIWVGAGHPAMAVERVLPGMPQGGELDRLLQELYPLVSILTVTIDNLPITRLCLKSILENTIYPYYEIIIVDNGSTDDSPAFLRQAAQQDAHLRVILNPENLGFSGGNNCALRVRRGEFVVFLNNDTVMPPGWLVTLLDHLAEPGVGMVGPRTNYWGNDSRLEVHYPTLAKFYAFARQRERNFYGKAFEIPTLALYCLAMPGRVVEEIGLLDERFGIGLFEDDDYCYRVRLAGYRLLCAEDVIVHHWGKQSFSKLSPEKFDALFAENRRKFEEKWTVKWQPPKSGAST